MIRPLVKYISEEIISMGRRPRESERTPEKVVIAVAPMRDMARISPSIVG